jgi:exosortase/archaeosortase family protein
VTKHVTKHKGPGASGDKVILALAVRFLVCFAVFFAAIVWLSARTQAVADLQTATAFTATWLMSLTGVAATRVGTIIEVPGRQLAIGADCTGLTIAALLASLVLAYPVRLLTRGIGVLAGVVAIALANLVRLVAIAHMSGAPDWLFYGAHDFLFQVGMVAVAIGVWAYWLTFARARES